MYNNGDGTFLDPDGRPWPAACASLDAEFTRVDRWRALPWRTRLKVWSHYSLLVAHPAVAVLAFVAWVERGWLWLPVVFVVFALAFVGEVGLLWVVRSEEDLVVRRLQFAACSAVVEAVLTAVVLANVLVLMAQTSGVVVAGPPMALVAVLASVALVLDVRSVWSCRASLPRWR